MVVIRTWAGSGGRLREMSSWLVIRISCKLPMDLIKIPRCPPEHRGRTPRGTPRWIVWRKRRRDLYYWTRIWQRWCVIEGGAFHGGMLGMRAGIVSFCLFFLLHDNLLDPRYFIYFWNWILIFVSYCYFLLWFRSRMRFWNY